MISDDDDDMEDVFATAGALDRMSGSEIGSDDEISDADSDLAELENDIEKYNQSVRQFLATHHGGPLPAPKGKGKGGPRAPRAPPEPRGDIKARISKANLAFLNGDYAEARNIIFEVIRINAETHQAWTTLASIFTEEGLLDKALMSMVYAAHLRPRDVAGWLKVAEFALDVSRETGDVTTARLCYAAALRADPKNLDARTGRALICHRQGYIAMAINDYKAVLEKRPLQLELVRGMAEACLDRKDAVGWIPDAIEVYQRYIHHLQSQDLPPQPDEFSWHDVGMYTELLATAHEFREATLVLKSLSRWMLGLPNSPFWDAWTEDDREWDVDDARRMEIPEYETLSLAERRIYGDQLPVDFRARLGIYRLQTGDTEEALRHFSWLDPSAPEAESIAVEYPTIVSGIADHLFDAEMFPMATAYYELLRKTPEGCDAFTLLQLGRCYIHASDAVAAEECFLSSIELDAQNIEARIELASIYEAAKEDEEALILVREALALEAARIQAANKASHASIQGDEVTANELRSYLGFHAHQRQQASIRRHEPLSAGILTRRYRPRRLGDPSKRRREERERARHLADQYHVVQQMKDELIRHFDNTERILEWIDMAKVLVDDFRSSKKFYSWDRYMRFLKRTQAPASAKGGSGARSSLSEMEERLARAVVPHEMVDYHTTDKYSGIAFRDWLGLFLDYAICLVRVGQYGEAGNVCESARDSTVFRDAGEYKFLIDVTWGACAVFARDEETCVNVARQIIRDEPLASDPYRMFALLCRLCQSPASWYNSGPAQKFLLRQIKAMDVLAMGSSAPPKDMLDVNVLMLYGHILFTATSYTYALHYFLRARSLDPTNTMVNLSLGLGYIHYSLKRQSVNRQYLIMQGLSFLLDKQGGLLAQQSRMTTPEACYNVARSFHLLGLPHLAQNYYQQALSYATDSGPFPHNAEQQAPEGSIDNRDHNRDDNQYPSQDQNRQENQVSTSPSNPRDVARDTEGDTENNSSGGQQNPHQTDLPKDFRLALAYNSLIMQIQGDDLPMAKATLLKHLVM